MLPFDSYFYEDERGLFRECQFVMDLELAADFTPEVNDSEVQSFRLVSVEEVRFTINDSKVQSFWLVSVEEVRFTVIDSEVQS